MCKKNIRPRLDEYAVFSFEEICREYVARKNNGFDERLVELSEDDPTVRLVDAEELSESQG